MKQSTKLIVALFVVAVVAAGFIPLEKEDIKKPGPKEKLEKELLKHGVVLEDYYTTTVAELEKALGVNISVKGSERVGFVMLRSPLKDEASVFEQTLEAVVSAFPEVEAVAMLRLDSEPKKLVYAPVEVRSYANMQKLPLEMSRLLDRDSRAQLIAKALAENGVNAQKVYILTPEEAANLNASLSDTGEVALLALVIPREEFPGKLFEAFGIAFEVDKEINTVVAGNLLAKKAKAITFYYITREEYEKREALKLEELPTIEIPVE
jgi:hypothetical protein